MTSTKTPHEKCVVAVQDALLVEMQRAYGRGYEPIEWGSPLLEKMARAAVIEVLDRRDTIT